MIEEIDDKKRPQETVSEAPSLFNVAIRRELGKAYADGYSDGQASMWISFMLAVFMTMILMRVLRESI